MNGQYLIMMSELTCKKSAELMASPVLASVLKLKWATLGSNESSNHALKGNIQVP